MLAIVPRISTCTARFGAHLRWTMQCLVSFADRAGRCFPSVRKLAEQAEKSKSTAPRHLSALVGSGVVTRKRRPGGVYDYQIDRRFLPRAPVSHHQAEGVPRQTGQETEPGKKTGTRKRAQFAKSKGELRRDPRRAAKWKARLRSWRKSGFWLPLWGSKPGEAGCMAPAALLRTT